MGPIIFLEYACIFVSVILHFEVVVQPLEYSLEQVFILYML